jgi:Putative metal-binding motif
MSRLLPVLALLSFMGCFKPFSANNRYACSDGSRCPNALTCDDGVCCQPGGTPSCPTIPSGGVCADNAELKRYYKDGDGDGFGTSTETSLRCQQPVRGWSPLEGDCDDSNETVSPTAQEVCNGLDDNCNGVRDEGLRTRSVVIFPDEDGDGFGANDAGMAVSVCDLPKGYVGSQGDCAPTDDAIFPLQGERCNNIDDNCNGQVDESPLIDASNRTAAQNQQFSCNSMALGVCAVGRIVCEPSPSGNRLACQPVTSPSAERCDDQLDNDCDGVTDNQPGCGGPARLSEAQGQVRTFTVNSAGGLPALSTTDCLFQTTVSSMGWLSPLWTTSTPPYTPGAKRETDELHVWSIEAPVGESWDLTASKATLTLSFELAVLADLTKAGNVWNSAPQPVVQLCNTQGKLLRRYRPLSANAALGPNALRLSTSVPLGQRNADWEMQGNASLNEVRRVELILWPRNIGDDFFATTLLVRFSPSFGFVRP